ncbi:MAG TPA: hypothetical protein VG273_18140 [Bryobacteraceae bacterium]|jgi:hypothetical protein|nr:hypothetical protein [Bryobacteraceae bacterium]
MNKLPVNRYAKAMAGDPGLLETWHNGGDMEIAAYARSLQSAAQTLAGKMKSSQVAPTGWDSCPIVLLYRQALEIHLKLLVGEGSVFLKTRTDPISLSTTHSLRWLAQIVCQIVRRIGWEKDFKCDSMASLADFTALVNEVESFDPVSRAILHSRAKGPNSLSEYYRTFDVVEFAKKLDALLVLVDATADAIAATWDQQADSAAGGQFRAENFNPTIQ